MNNDTSDTFRMALPKDNPLQTAGILRITDPIGKELRLTYFPEGQKELLLDLNYLPGGLYFLHLHGKNKDYSEELILQH